MIRHKLKWGAVPLLAAAMLAAGCTKEATVPGLQIFEEGMTTGNGSKVLVNPSNPTHNTWKSWDYIRVFYSGTADNYKVKESSGNYYIEYDPTSNGEFIACYPTSGGYSSVTTTSVTMSSINTRLDYPDGYNGNVDVLFPMVAFGDENSTSLTFQHVTGAIAFNIVNNSGEEKYIYEIEITNDIAIWPKYGGATFNCSKDAGGNLVVSFDGGEKKKYCDWNTIDEDYSSPVRLPNGASMYIVFPVPETSGTQFQFSVNAQTRTWHEAVIDPETGDYLEPEGWNYEDNYVTKTIDNLTIQRNHILRLPNFVIE